MSLARRLAHAFTLLVWIVMAGCAEPPSKEMDQAQAAVEAARSVDAARYAPAELAAAEAALTRAREAVDQRDYRLALNHALDSLEQARAASLQAVSTKTASQTSADRAIGESVAAIADAKSRLKTAEGARAPARRLADARRALADAERGLQEARSAFEKGDFTAVNDALPPLTTKLVVITKDLAKTPARPARRRG
jgi:hypothetical protein